jgi:GntR family transcriptional regulator
MTTPGGVGGRSPIERNGLTLYAQLDKEIRSRIFSGEWPVGSMIPPEPRLCEMFQVSRITVRQALSRLAAEGFIVREQGRGTFVRDRNLVADARSVRSFTDEVIALGMTPSNRLLGVREVRPRNDVRDALGLGPGDRVLRIVRLRLGDGKPIGLQTAALVSSRVPGLSKDDLEAGSLYETLRTRFGIRPSEAIETFTVGGISEKDAKLLKVASSTPAFFVERVTSDNRGPFEHVSSVMRGDRYRIRLAIRNINQ